MSTSRSSCNETTPSVHDIPDSLDACGSSDIELSTPMPVQSATTLTVPAEQHTSPLKDENTLTYCDFDCGPPMPRRDMVNKGNSRSHCWICRPCHCSMTAIIRSWSKTPDTKAMLEQIRSKDKPRWQALVRQCRIRATAEEVGLPDIRARKRQVIESTVFMQQSFGIRETADAWQGHAARRGRRGAHGRLSHA